MRLTFFAGLGVFLQYLIAVLPVFLLIVGFVAIVIAIGMAIAHVIKGAMHTKYR